MFKGIFVLQRIQLPYATVFFFFVDIEAFGFFSYLI